MGTVTTHQSRDARLSRVSVLLLAAVLAATVIFAIPVVNSYGVGAPVLRSVDVNGYANALATSTSKSLYLLTSEKGAAVKCRDACLSTWLPLLVKNSVTTITLGTGVRGTVGFVARGIKMKQVTYNSYPVYTYAGDRESREHGGEGLANGAGAWYLVKAGATSSSETPFKTSTSTATTTEPASTTTTAPVPTTTTTKPAPTTTTTKPAPTTTTTSSVGGVAY